MASYAQADMLKANSTVYATNSTVYANMSKNTHCDDKYSTIIIILFRYINSKNTFLLKDLYIELINIFQIIFSFTASRH